MQATLVYGTLKRYSIWGDKRWLPTINGSNIWLNMGDLFSFTYVTGSLSEVICYYKMVLRGPWFYLSQMHSLFKINSKYFGWLKSNRYNNDKCVFTNKI